MSIQQKVNTNYKQLVHYYALETENKSKPIIFESLFPMPSSIAIEKINERFKKEKKHPFYGQVLMVTYDLVGRRFYLPELENINRVEDGSKLSAMFSAVKIQIEKDYGDIAYPSANPPIPAEPSTTFRVKKFSNFPSSWAFVKKAFPDANVKDLPVIEANLSIMPTTAAKIRPAIGNKKGAYISPKLCNSVQFQIKNRDNTETMVYNQSAPFIVIDISPSRKTTFPDREQVLLTSFKEALDEITGGEMIGEMTSSQFYSLEIMMYLGWSIQEICQYLISTENTVSAEAALSKGSYVLYAAEKISELGFKNPAERPYYYSFEFGDKFPLNLHKTKLFDILNLDTENNWVTIRSRIFLSDEILHDFFDSISNIIRGQADPRMMTFYVNQDATELREGSPSCYWAMINFARSDTKNKDIAFKTFSETESFFERKSISMYPQAEEILLKTCKKMRTSFDDLEVIVGPWQKTNLQLTAGFISREIIEQKKLPIPLEIVPGLKIYPPIIAVDSSEHPSVPDRTNFIIHEYQHYLNLKTGLVGAKVSYNVEEMQGNNERFIKDYLGDKNEELAHIAQAKSLLASGMSKDDLLNFFIPDGLRGPDQVAQAAKYYEFIEAAYNELAAEEADNPTEEDFNAGERQQTDKTPRVQTPGSSEMGNSQG